MKTLLALILFLWAAPLGAAETPLPSDLTGTCRVLPEICALEAEDEAPEDDDGVVRERAMGLTRSAACREAKDEANLECTTTKCLGCVEVECDCICLLGDINCICTARGVACVAPREP